MSDDPSGERVAADAGRMFVEQVSRSKTIPGRRCIDHFNVVAFPAHLSATRSLSRRPVQRAEVGECNPEGRIGGHGEPQCDEGEARVAGSLSLPVPGRRLSVGGNRAAVILDGWTEVWRQRRAMRKGTTGLLHGCQVDPTA